MLTNPWLSTEIEEHFGPNARHVIIQAYCKIDIFQSRQFLSSDSSSVSPFAQVKVQVLVSFLRAHLRSSPTLIMSTGQHTPTYEALTCFLSSPSANHLSVHSACLHGEQSFQSLLNSTPSVVQKHWVPIFKSGLKTHLFKIAYSLSFQFFCVCYCMLILTDVYLFMFNIE